MSSTNERLKVCRATDCGHMVEKQTLISLQVVSDALIRFLGTAIFVYSPSFNRTGPVGDLHLHSRL